MSEAYPKHLFELETDPFPHLRVRDVLVAVGSTVDQLTERYKLTQEEDPALMSLEDADRKFASDFAGVVRRRFRELPTRDTQVGYISFWEEVYKMCEYHQVESQYGMGTEKPDPGSSDTLVLEHRLGTDKQKRTEYIQQCLSLIDESRYPKLFDVILDNELKRKDVIVQHLGISDEQRTTGLIAAYSDARLLLLEANSQMPYAV